MGKTHKLHSIVLHTHNVGEADRFCILLTAERGRLAVRAYGARKLTSRLGGSLLPLQEVMLTAREGSAGWSVSDCQSMTDGTGSLPWPSFMHAVQCTDILLSLLEDDTPVPEVFTLLQQFLQACRKGATSPALLFTVQLLGILGLLPTHANHALYDHFLPEEKIFLEQALAGNWHQPAPEAADLQRLSFLCSKILAEQSQRPLKSTAVAKVM